MKHNLYDPNAERAVISAILNEPDVIPQVLNDLREEYFGEKEHKILLSSVHWLTHAKQDLKYGDIIYN